MSVNMQFMLFVMLLVIATALSMLVGIILLPWRKTRPFGLYALLIEPGGVAGLVVASFVWEKMYSLVPTLNQPQWAGWAVVLLLGAWLGLGLALGAVSGFTLATWLWWKFSPDPYRPLLVNGYCHLLAMRPWHRQRWGKRVDRKTAAEFDIE
jgi:hypothetical protein